MRRGHPFTGRTPYFSGVSELPQPPAFDPEAQYIRGIPYPLPKGERILWQGGPEYFALARHVFKVPVFVLYFSVLVVVQGWYVTVTRDSQAAAQVLLPLTVAGMGTCLYMLMFAWLTARNSWYAVTTRRVVLKVGVALTVTVNVPLRVIASAGVRRFSDGSGELAFPLAPEERLSLFQLWPHWRPWNINRPVPQMRGLRQLDAVAEALKQALESTRDDIAAGAAAPAQAPRHPAPVAGAATTEAVAAGSGAQAG